MTKSFSLGLLLFVVFGCATLSEQPETPAAADPENRISSPETENVPSNASVKLSNVRESDDKQSSSVTLDTEKIRQVQTLLKTVGFDPGRIDGAFGLKTKKALLRLRSSCSGLNDLLQGVDLEKIAPAIESSGAHRKDAVRAMLRKEEIRVIQVRLKDAGFDPGTVDGISGPDTRSAVARFRSGCGALKTMPPAVFEAAGSAEQSDMNGPTTARNGRTADAVRQGGVAHSKSSRLSGTATNDSSAVGMRRRQNQPKGFGSSPASLDGDASEKAGAELGRRDATGANRSSPARPSSAIPTIQY